ncbi:MAG: MFS transporter, partial [Rhodospirillaceae bacterium]|nr:MFS transporter [Rhodospirillaceae bacterium]
MTSKRAPDRVASYQEAVILPELANTPGQPATPTSVSRWAVLAVLVVARLGVGFQFIAIAALMSDFRADLGADHAEIGVLLGIFMLTGIFLSLPSGMIAARFGDRRVLLTGLAALSVGGLIVALSETVSVAILGRMVAGLGAVFTSVTAAKVVADRFVGREIATAMSFLGLAWPLGIAFGVSLLPILGDLSGWRLGIIATAVMPAVAAAVVVLLPMGSAAAPEKTDAPFWNLSRREFMLVSVCGLAWPLMATGGYV